MLGWWQERGKLDDLAHGDELEWAQDADDGTWGLWTRAELAGVRHQFAAFLPPSEQPPSPSPEPSEDVATGQAAVPRAALRSLTAGEAEHRSNLGITCIGNVDGRPLFSAFDAEAEFPVYFFEGDVGRRLAQRYGDRLSFYAWLDGPQDSAWTTWSRGKR